jgi:autophagy-related protein 5
MIYPDVSPADAWLSYDGVPLKWHYPLGLLYDLYSGAEPSHPPDEDGNNEGKVDEDSIPWKLTLHFSGYPDEHLVKLDAEGKHLHDLFIHSVKEVQHDELHTIEWFTNLHQGRLSPLRWQDCHVP